MYIKGGELFVCNNCFADGGVSLELNDTDGTDLNAELHPVAEAKKLLLPHEAQLDPLVQQIPTMRVESDDMI